MSKIYFNTVDLPGLNTYFTYSRVAMNIKKTIIWFNHFNTRDCAKIIIESLISVPKLKVSYSIVCSIISRLYFILPLLKDHFQ